MVEMKLVVVKHTLKLALLGGAVVALSACAGGSPASSRGIDKTRQETAFAMWKEHCQKATGTHRTPSSPPQIYTVITSEKDTPCSDEPF